MVYPNQIDSERKEVLRLLSLYHQLSLQQIQRTFPSISETALLSMLKHLQKQGRLQLHDTSVICIPEESPIEGISEAFDVLLDFFPEVSYHAPGDFPITITFFAREEGYDIIWLPSGKELLIAQALSLQPHSTDSNQRLVLLSSRSQLAAARTLPYVAAFCLTENGNISYYKKQQEDS